ncbi:uncharacterized protein LOC131876031 [Cryptomeria japonica]|uniref:uncharacterized protein LOC131876031 n=1 Tax=Cryptomeria japonica TaxID=3369 RepID=UPI0027DA3976|nr:uncharacterized protein LOC131876031 [Cryptomeria japonica]
MVAEREGGEEGPEPMDIPDIQGEGVEIRGGAWGGEGQRRQSPVIGRPIERGGRRSEGEPADNTDEGGGSEGKGKEFVSQIEQGKVRCSEVARGAGCGEAVPRSKTIDDVVYQDPGSTMGGRTQTSVELVGMRASWGPGSGRLWGGGASKCAGGGGAGGDSENAI